MNRLSKLAAAAFALAAASSPTAAQDGYPSKPVRWIVPYSAGGLPDTIARVVAQKVSESLGQQVTIENRGGAGGITGSEAVARAAPDGYTFLVADVGQVAINQHLYAKLPYDPNRDLVPVGLIATANLFLVANAAVPVKDFGELVALARAKPGVLNYGSSGVGSIHHLSMEALKSALGLEIVHVPYKGTGQSIPALVGGDVTIAYSAMPSIAAHVKAGRVKVLAVSTIKRSTSAPDVPTIAELGVPGYDFAPEIGLLAPTGTPPAIVTRMSQEVAKAVQSPEVAQRFAQLDIEPVGSTPAEYAARIRAADEKYAQAVKVSGARLDN
ncbi:MAG TPA: tripartite tricarboxylate transporter substrate binding protein [Burkholderiales bacterium]|nr:tripartite tricarboxylate transporter substrate binding protein [Burkholderiales bacterium]